MDMKKKSILAIAVFSLFGIAAAAWVLYYDSGITGYVIGGANGEMLFSDNFDLEQNNDSASFNKTQSLEIVNNNGVAVLNVDINTTITDVPDSCDNTGDVEVLVEYDGLPISNGDNITVANGVSEINVTTSAVERSCPQAVETKITLNQVEA